MCTDRKRKFSRCCTGLWTSQRKWLNFRLLTRLQDIVHILHSISTVLQVFHWSCFHEFLKANRIALFHHCPHIRTNDT
jgi:hypothetical protein